MTAATSPSSPAMLDAPHVAQPHAARDAVTPADPARRIEELGRIILAYSEVTEKLQQSHERLEQTVQMLRRELGEKDRLLERKNRLAALGEMAAGMAHEIRNPLGGIQLYASLLAKDVADRPAAREVVGKIDSGVRRLESLVSHLLQFTREMTASTIPCDLAEIVDQAIDLAAGALEKHGATVERTGPRPMPVQVDPLLLGQALLNLLINAAEAASEEKEEKRGHHSFSRPRIHLEYSAPSTRAEGRQFHLVVQDQGPGVSPSVMDSIFNPFFTTKETGTGLGLAIVHRVVEAHDGSILVTNVEPKGARFEIRI